jgi:hypothetical protein
VTKANLIVLPQEDPNCATTIPVVGSPDEIT